MANWGNMILTAKGQILYAKAQTGITINFTRMGAGAGQLGNTNPELLTNLINLKMYFDIQSKTVDTEGKTAAIRGTLRNNDILESFSLCELGLFAEDPNEGEILYCYVTAGSEGDYISPASSGPRSWTYELNAAVGNAPNVTVNLSQLQYDSDTIISSNLTIINGETQKEVNESIDNKFKIYPTTNNGNTYAITNSDIDSLTDGYPLKVRFNADSTGNSALIINNSNAMDIVDYFGNKVSNIRKDLIANIIYDAKNLNFQLLGKGGEGDATPDQVLINHKFTNNLGVHVGAMPENGNLNANLDSGQSFNIPAGHTTGGTVKANSLASQTQATADSSKILDGFDAWVDGNLIHGQATIESLGGTVLHHASATSMGTLVGGQTSAFYYNYLDLSGIGFDPQIITGTAGNVRFSCIRNLNNPMATYYSGQDGVDTLIGSISNVPVNQIPTYCYGTSYGTPNWQAMSVTWEAWGW